MAELPGAEAHPLDELHHANSIKDVAHHGLDHSVPTIRLVNNDRSTFGTYCTARAFDLVLAFYLGNLQYENEDGHELVPDRPECTYYCSTVCVDGHK